MNTKKIKQQFHEFILLLGVMGLVSVISYGFILVGPYVDSRIDIGIYVFAMFILLPVATYVLISLYMWVLERWLSD